MAFDRRDWPNTEIPIRDWPDPPRMEQEDPPSSLGAGQPTPVHITTTEEGAPGGFIHDQPLENGRHLWGVCVGRTAHVQCPIEGMLQEFEAEGGLAGGRLKALAELQALLRATPAETQPDTMLSVPAWHLVLLTRMAMERLS